VKKFKKISIGQFYTNGTLFIFNSDFLKKMSNTKDDVINVVLFGEGGNLFPTLNSKGSGKSSFTVSFVRNQFLTEYDPTIEDHYHKMIQINGKNKYLQILDTAGREGLKIKFHSKTSEQ
jgi:hypothetical protein